MSKRLLLIIPIFPKNENEDTIVPFIAQFIDFFSKKHKNICIDILTINYPLNKGPYKRNNITIYAVGGKFKKGIHNSLIRFFKSLFIGVKLSRRYNYSGMLSFWYGETALLGSILKLLFGTPHFTWMQGQDIKANNSYLKILSPKKDTLIVVGKNHNELLYKHQKIKASSIANVAIVPENFPELNTSNRPIDVIGVGNLSTLKNYSLFVDIIYELQKNNKTINAVICGDGDEMQMLTNKITSLGLTENIQLTGYISNKKVRSLMNSSKVLLHTSKFEGNSLVVQEALYSGCKVVSSIPLLEKINNFYFEDSKNDKIKRVNQILSERVLPTQRIRHFKIEDTVETIYSCFFNDK